MIPSPEFHPCIFYTHLIQFRVVRGLKLFPAVTGQEGGYTLGRPSQGHIETNLTFMFLDCGRKLDYPEKTHAYMGRTCKFHTVLTRNPLAVR